MTPDAQLSLYGASTDWYVWGLTAGLTVMLVGVALLLGVVGWFVPYWSIRIGLCLAIVLCLSILVGTYLYSPRAYRIENSALVIERPIGDVTIPFTSVRSVAPMDECLAGSWKTLGNSGLFGIYGTFYNKKLGHFRMYAQRTSRAVILHTDRESIIVTPDDGERFIRELTDRLGQGRGS